jgi:hypothetical protein
MIRRPRSVAIPICLTVLTLVGLTFRVARFGERITVRIISPVASVPPQVIRPGKTIHVEAIVDAGDSPYKAVDQIGLGINYSADNGPVRSYRHRDRFLVTNYDPATKRFTHDVPIWGWPGEQDLQIGIVPNCRTPT